MNIRANIHYKIACFNWHGFRIAQPPQSVTNPVESELRSAAFSLRGAQTFNKVKI